MTDVLDHRGEPQPDGAHQSAGSSTDGSGSEGAGTTNFFVEWQLDLDDDERIRE